MRKFLALLLSVLMIMTLTVSASAVPRPEPKSLTIASDPSDDLSVVAPRPIQPSNASNLEPDIGPNAWLVNPLRAAVSEWYGDEAGQYAWFIGPLKERGVTQADLLAVCDRLSAADPSEVAALAALIGLAQP